MMKILSSPATVCRRHCIGPRRVAIIGQPDELGAVAAALGAARGRLANRGERADVMDRIAQ